MKRGGDEETFDTQTTQTRDINYQNSQIDNQAQNGYSNTEGDYNNARFGLAKDNNYGSH